ncbi:MAG: hypothetical protein BWY74_02076 [Firmicutes bacterium ADurb.Bin419]|nr:MAG: hypothetical protein BWY74_02076 [Firmicutes bacterium ADurb.Bin419]
MKGNIEDLYGTKYKDAYFKMVDYDMYKGYIRDYGMDLDENAKYISFSVTNDNKFYYSGFADEKCNIIMDNYANWKYKNEMRLLLEGIFEKNNMLLVGLIGFERGRKVPFLSIYQIHCRIILFLK